MTNISNLILNEFKKNVKDENEYDMIVEMLEKVKRYKRNEKSQTVKRDFQLLMDQYFEKNFQLSLIYIWIHLHIFEE